METHREKILQSYILDDIALAQKLTAGDDIASDAQSRL